MQSGSDELQQIREILQATALQQQVNTQAIAALENQMARTGDRLDAFIAESQRLFTRLGEQAERHPANLDTLNAAVQRLMSRTDEDRTESRNTAMELRSMVSRLDALVNYLMRSDRG